jgi:rhodanese-related sulfurtransferase
VISAQVIVSSSLVTLSQLHGSSTTLPTVRRSSIARWASSTWFIGNRWPTSTFSSPLSTEPLSERVASPSNARCAPSEAGQVEAALMHVDFGQHLTQRSPRRGMFLVLLPVQHMYGSSVSHGSNLAMPTEPLRGSDVISVRELADMRSAGKKHTVLDVREARELDVCRLEGALHIPMAEIPAQTDNLPTDQLLVVICHHGARSQMVVDFLRNAGFDNAVNLDGGIDAWACDVDLSMPRYR